MVHSVVLACTLLMIQTGVIKSAIEEHSQQDIAEIIEAKLGNQTILRFNDPVPMEGYSLLQWKIQGPYKSTECEKSKRKLSDHQGKYIMICTEEPNSTLTVLLNEFKSHHAGKWMISKKYRKYRYENITSTEISFNVIGFEFLEKYHNQIFKMNDGDYFLILFEETVPDYSILRLVKEETNTVYDLNAMPYRFSKSKADIKRLSTCGFHMHARNTSHGNWSLIGRSGWIERRAKFEVLIDSSPIQPEKIFEIPTLAGFDGLAMRTEASDSFHHIELETPDGNIMISSGVQLNISLITTAHNGFWKFRFNPEDRSSLVLNEMIVPLTVLDLPQIYYTLEKLDDRLYNLYVGVSIEYISELELRNEDGEIFLGKSFALFREDCSVRKDITCFSDCEKLCAGTRRFVVENLNLSDSIGAEMEVSFGCEAFHMKALITPDPRVPHGSIQYPSHLWYSVQRKKYVTRQESLEVKCIASAPLTNCTLKSPEDETYTFGDNPLVTGKNCSKLGGNCGCIAIIGNVTDIHTGNWTCEMVFENGRKMESLVPVQVLESFLIPDVTINETAHIKLNCQLSPMHQHKKIEECEWFGPNGIRVDEKNWTRYHIEKDHANCALEFKGSYKKDSELWKCIAHLDEYPKNEIYATLNVSKQSFENIKPNPKNESSPTISSRSEEIFGDSGASHFEIEIFIEDESESRFCTIEGQNGEFYDASRIFDDNQNSGWMLRLVITREPENIVTQKWEVFIDNQQGISASVTTVMDGSGVSIEVKDFRHTFPKMAVLKRGSKFEINYRSEKDLRTCDLESPWGQKYHNHIYIDVDPVQLDIDEEGYSCRIVINNATDEYSGNWYLETISGDHYQELQNTLIIQVIESYIVLESERGLHPDVNIKLHCRRRTIMYDVKIKDCKWFRPDGGQIFINESSKYNATEEYDVCTLELKDPNEDDFGYWKCLASLDGYSDEEIAILNLSQTDITVNKHYKKQEIGKDNGSEGKSSKLRMMIGDAVELICLAPVSKYRDKIEWHHSDSKQVDKSERMKIHELPRSTTHYRSMLSINTTLPSDKTFICSTMLRGNHTDTSYFSMSYTIEFSDIAPFFVDTNMNATKWKYNLNITNPENIILKCYADGVPRPKIVWKRNGIKIENNSRLKTDLCNATFLNHSQELHIDASDVLCTGQYLCEVGNYIAVIEKYQTIIIEEQKNSTINTIIESSSTLLIVLILFLILLSLVVCCCLSDRIRLKKKITEVESTMGLNETQLGPLNPEEMLHEQADFLPYDRKRWEYPEDNLEIGEQLGHGFFGVVMEAKAPNIHKDGKTPTVAVKKLHSYLRFSNESHALEIELRILANLEKHPNVVNLLGACTDKVAIGHLLVILEYCPLGNLLDFLRGNSSRFIDQIDPLSRIINFSMKKSGISQESSIEDPVLMNTDTVKEPKNILGDGKVPEEFRIQPRNYEKASICNWSIQPSSDINLYTLTPEKNIMADNEDSVSISNMNLYAVAPEKKVADNNEDFVSTQNLLEWAHQIACAMEYLSGKKILHGDLAARNILLTERRVAKICDFGLARTLPNGHYYKKMDAVMPLKWMAIESIERRKFSTQSDVWSFGILLWECFTLGKTPYDGSNLKETIALLKSGSRLEMPKYSTQAIYDIMFQCWDLLPENRPSFNALIQEIDKILNYSMK